MIRVISDLLAIKKQFLALPLSRKIFYVSLIIVAATIILLIGSPITTGTPGIRLMLFMFGHGMGGQIFGGLGIFVFSMLIYFIPSKILYLITRKFSVLCITLINAWLFLYLAFLLFLFPIQGEVL